MGVDLTSVKGKKGAYFNWTAWRFLLKTAADYGWVPEGTVLDFSYQYRSATRGRKLSELSKARIKLEIRESCANWAGDYSTNHCQLVTADDAGNIQKALLKALNDRRFVVDIKSEQTDILIQFTEFLKNGAFRIS